MFSRPRSVLPVDSSTIWSVHYCNGIRNSNQGSQDDGSKQGHKNPPVPRQLVGQSHIPPNLSPAYTNPSSSVSRIRLIVNMEKSKLEPKQVLDFVGY